MRSTTSISGSSLKAPRVSFRKNLGGAKAKTVLPPKIQQTPSTAKKLPIVGNYA